MSENDNCSEISSFWFFTGAYFATSTLIAGLWFFFEPFRSSWGDIARGIVAVTVGSCLVVGILGTAIDVAGHTALRRLQSRCRTRVQLLMNGVIFTYLTIPLNLFLALGTGVGVDNLGIRGLRSVATVHVGLGLTFTVLSTAVTVRLLAAAVGKNAARPK